MYWSVLIFSIYVQYKLIQIQYKKSVFNTFTTYCLVLVCIDWYWCVLSTIRSMYWSVLVFSIYVQYKQIQIQYKKSLFNTFTTYWLVLACIVMYWFVFSSIRSMYWSVLIFQIQAQYRNRKLNTD